jgi:hypothetical protein
MNRYVKGHWVHLLDVRGTENAETILPKEEGIIHSPDVCMVQEVDVDGLIQERFLDILVSAWGRICRIGCFSAHVNVDIQQTPLAIL